MSKAESAPEQEPTATRRSGLIKGALTLEWVTVAWMAIEAIVAVTSGIAARDVALFAWGIDSVIELASAGVLIWRLSAELQRRDFAESTERTASRLTGGLLFVLAADVIASAGSSLW